MFDQAALTRAVRLHQLSFDLFCWLKDGRGWSWLQATAELALITQAQEAAGWLSREHASLPPDCRPDAADIAAVANLLVSFLATSYELRDGPHGRYLNVRRLGHDARARARQLERLALSRLACELELPLLDREIEPLVLAGGDVADARAWLAYGVELLRRTEFASQGEGVAWLWRRIAWENGANPKAGFRLAAADFLGAEARLTSELRAIADAA